jgi:hypothetical protein
MSNNNLIFLGLTHGFLDDSKKLKEIFKKFHPKIILHESLENKKLLFSKDYTIFLNKKTHSEMTSFLGIEEIVKFCYKNKVPLVGIDFENYSFSKELRNRINSGKRTNLINEIRIKKIIRKREKHHIKLIEKYNNLSAGPILVCLGSWHLRRNSPIRKQFIGARIIFPADEKGNILTKPTKSKISYCEDIL